MASVSSQEEDSFTCPVCLELLRDPVTTACGHNFCMRCIKGCWDQEDGKGEYTCPLCKHSFNSRPVLHKNHLMAEMVEKFAKTSLQAAAPAHFYAGSGDVECDVCTGRKFKAIKSCQECLLSYCDTHLKAHNELIGRNHTIIDSTGQLQERICPRHKKVFEIFCRTDQSCICYLCTMDNHKGHDTITATAEFIHKKEGLGQSQKRCQQIIHLKEKELQELRKAVETLKSGAQTAVEESARMFTELIRSIERRCSEVTKLIRAQEKAEVSRAEGLLKRLEQEIAELKRTDAEMKQLSQTQDPIYFLKNMVSIDGDPCSPLKRMVFSQSHFFEPLKESVSALKMQLEKKLDSIFKQEIVKISAAATKEQITPEIEYTDPELPVRRTNSKERLQPNMFDGQALIAEPVTREDFMKYSCHFTLDPSTANRHLHLSEGNRRVERRPEAQPYPDHPDRFDEYSQVLCREGVSARCYWEVEWNGGVYIAVAYKGISRKGCGNECGFGLTDQSWRLLLSSSSSSFRHNKKATNLRRVTSSRIGVYVDHRAGTLAFYSISGDTMTLLHRVHTTFTDTLYPGFLLGSGSVKLL